MIAEFFFRSDLVLLGTPLIAVGGGRQGAGAQTLHFQGLLVVAAVVLPHHHDLQHPMIDQLIIHCAYKLIGVGLFVPSVPITMPTWSALAGAQKRAVSCRYR